MMDTGEPENGKRFFPSGAIFFFPLLILFYAALWLVIYYFTPRLAGAALLLAIAYAPPITQTIRSNFPGAPRIQIGPDGSTNYSRPTREVPARLLQTRATLLQQGTCWSAAMKNHTDPT